ncbi:ribonuclease P protein subunit p25-like protein isoform X2 [Sceloporus undulatus]|uniref:ribonuclease P protein subunit p25-like protein isoform X2 n=1 Tax=Sceloporus undulatus TaxID=8520 RepID=UPI001C4B5DBC|nr:ribonuclease P protein subunit p25-like protein isoform X2 [Sceloporus undulatus]
MFAGESAKQPSVPTVPRAAREHAQACFCSLSSPSESVMENYRKSKTVEKPSPLPFTNLPSDIIEMKVKDGSKIRNLMGYAFGKMESDAMRQVLFSGAGKAISKTITCVEIMKRRMKSLHQITKVFFRQTEEIWDPIVPEAGLDPLTVKRNIPAICVLLSKDPLDTKEPGYQAPGCFDAFWLETLKSESQGQAKRKQGGGRGAGRAGKHPRSVGREDAYKKP